MPFTMHKKNFPPKIFRTFTPNTLIFLFGLNAKNWLALDICLLLMLSISKMLFAICFSFFRKAEGTEKSVKLKSCLLCTKLKSSLLCTAREKKTSINNIHRSINGVCFLYLLQIFKCINFRTIFFSLMINIPVNQIVNWPYVAAVI